MVLQRLMVAVKVALDAAVEQLVAAEHLMLELVAQR